MVMLVLLVVLVMLVKLWLFKGYEGGSVAYSYHLVYLLNLTVLPVLISGGVLLV